MTPSALELVSWNLNGLDEAGLGPRCEAALQDILLGARVEAIARGERPRAPPQVILLQEVTAASFLAILRPHLRAAGFRIAPERPPDRTYFEVVAVRPAEDLEAHAAEPLVRSMFGRWQHLVHVRRGPSTWRVLTAHFDSGPEPGTKAVRADQTRDVAAQLTDGPAVFAGDTNLRDPEWAKVGKGLAVVDAWEASGADPRHRFTWFGGHRRARFDRVWVSPEVRVRRFETIGAVPVTGLGAPPSDHLGVRVALEVTTPEIAGSEPSPPDEPS